MVSPKYTVILEHAEEGGYIVRSVDLPVTSQGENKKEALKNIKEAIEGYLQSKTEPKTKKTINRVTVRVLPEVTVSQEEKEEIKRSVKEMKEGNFVTLQELTEKENPSSD